MSRHVIRSSRAAPHSEFRALTAVALVSATAVAFFFHQQSILYFGDAEAHLNIARRIIDSRTPGYDQLGTVWLPLPHLLMLPLVANDWLWQTGLAGAIPSAACFIAAAMFLFAATRRVLDSETAAWTAIGVFVLNPNALYLQSIPMTESVFFAALLGLLYFSVRGSAVGAGIMALSATLTRYEGWFLLPFVALFFWRSHGWRAMAKFSGIAAIGPLWWFLYNWQCFRNPLEFYNGPYSARAIQGSRPYPGRGQWLPAMQYFFTAARSGVGIPLLWIGAAGWMVAVRRAAWPALLLALPPIFYVWSIHSSGTPIFVPELWPHSWYNTRYGLAMLPLVSFGAAALVPRGSRILAPIGVLICILPWLIHHHPVEWITWKESEVNSQARRAWTHQAAAFLQTRFHRGDTVFTGFSDITGVYREAGIPLRLTLTADNGLHWMASSLRPDLFLWDQWAICMKDDAVDQTMKRAEKTGPAYEMVKTVQVNDAPEIRIYRRRAAGFSLPKPDSSGFLSPTTKPSTRGEKSLASAGTSACRT